MDIQRARRIERSWAPKDLSEAQAEYVVRAIAQGIAQGRRQGLDLAKALDDGLPNGAGETVAEGVDQAN
jgi:hypothetical protein